MSDVWQGPGWWLASDGKWYPPEAQPGAQFDPQQTAPDSSGDSVVAEAAPEQAQPLGDVVVATEPKTAMPVEEVVTPAVPTLEDVVAPTVDTVAPTVDTAIPAVVPPVVSDAPAIANENAIVPGWQAIVEPDPVQTPVVHDVETPVVADVPASFPDPIVEPVTSFEAASPVGEAAPAPIVEATPSVTEEPVPAPVESLFGTPAAPDVSDMSDVIEAPPTVIDESGWTSGFEESQLASSAPVTPDVPVVPQAPAAVEIPDVAAPVANADITTSAGIDDPNDIFLAPPLPEPAATIAEPIITPTPDMPVVPDVAEIPDVVEIPDVAAPVSTLQQTPLTVDDTELATIDQTEVVEQTQVIVEQGQTPLASNAVDAYTTGPIERNTAWRTPTQDTPVETPLAASSGAVITTTPSVVDLAIPDDSPLQVPESDGPNWKGIFRGLAILLAVIGLAAAIIWYLYRDDDPDPVDSSTTTTAVATTVPEVADADPSLVSIFELRAGDCIDGDIAAGPVTEITKVDCEEPHEFEVYREALIDSSIVDYDAASIAANAEQICRDSLAAYIPADDERNILFKFLQPTEDSWNRSDQPDRVITCLLYDDDGPLIGKAA